MKKLVALLFIISFISISVAQKNNVQTRLTPNAKQNLIIALNSDNAGLKRSAVYFAGYYKIDEAVGQITELLNSSSTDISLKTLAAYSLHQIGNEECIEALKEAVNYSSDKSFCTKCKLLYQDLISTRTAISYQ